MGIMQATPYQGDNAKQIADALISLKGLKEPGYNGIKIEKVEDLDQFKPVLKERPSGWFGRLIEWLKSCFSADSKTKNQAAFINSFLLQNQDKMIFWEGVKEPSLEEKIKIYSEEIEVIQILSLQFKKYPAVCATIKIIQEKLQAEMDQIGKEFDLEVQKDGETLLVYDQLLEANNENPIQVLADKVQKKKEERVKKAEAKIEGKIKPEIQDFQNRIEKLQNKLKKKVQDQSKFLELQNKRNSERGKTGFGSQVNKAEAVKFLLEDDKFKDLVIFTKEGDQIKLHLNLFPEPFWEDEAFGEKEMLECEDGIRRQVIRLEHSIKSIDVMFHFLCQAPLQFNCSWDGFFELIDLARTCKLKEMKQRILEEFSNQFERMIYVSEDSKLCIFNRVIYFFQNLETFQGEKFYPMFIQAATALYANFKLISYHDQFFSFSKKVLMDAYKYAHAKDFSVVSDEDLCNGFFTWAMMNSENDPKSAADLLSQKEDGKESLVDYICFQNISEEKFTRIFKSHTDIFNCLGIHDYEEAIHYSTAFSNLHSCRFMDQFSKMVINQEGLLSIDFSLPIEWLKKGITIGSPALSLPNRRGGGIMFYPNSEDSPPTYSCYLQVYDEPQEAQLTDVLCKVTLNEENGILDERVSAPKRFHFRDTSSNNVMNWNMNELEEALEEGKNFAFNITLEWEIHDK